MTLTQAYSLRCSILELTTLCQMLGATAVLGLPCQDLSETALSSEELQAGLEEKGYLLRREGSLAVAPEILCLMNTVVSPTACLSQGLLTDREAPLHVAFYWQPPNLVQLQRLTTQEWRVERLGQVSESWNAVSAFWSQARGGESRRRKIVLPQSVFDLARTWIERGQEDEFARQMLSWRAPEDFSTSLAEALVQPLAQAALCAFERVPNGWGLEGYGYFRGAANWWRTRPCQRSNEPWLEICEVGAEDGGERAATLLKRMLHV